MSILDPTHRAVFVVCCSDNACPENSFKMKGVACWGYDYGGRRYLAAHEVEIDEVWYHQVVGEGNLGLIPGLYSPADEQLLMTNLGDDGDSIDITVNLPAIIDREPLVIRMGIRHEVSW